MIAFEISSMDDASLVIEDNGRLGEHREELNRLIAVDCTMLTETHLELIAPFHHKTAERLGAQPTNYLYAIAELLQPYWDNTRASILFPTQGLEIFARVNGPVEVRAIRGKYLTIPATAEAYGVRATTIPGLKFIPFANGTRALVRQSVTMVPGKRPGTLKKQIVNDPIFWLKESVVLPEDQTLLPYPDQYADTAAAATTEYIIEQSNQMFDEFLPKSLGGTK